LIPEARRRRWLEDYPEATNTDEAVVFDTSIIPWWAWMKRFHLPETEKLNGKYEKTVEICCGCIWRFCAQ
jgi:hypothetical protein